MMFAGVVGIPNPERRNERTITNLVKQVTMISKPGASDRTVSKPNI
jgi:hypothetical protein